MKFRRRDGGFEARFDNVEVSLLGSLLDQLEALTEALGHDQVTQRLFPAGYRDDDEAAADFRELTQSSLQQERRERYGQCRAELPLRAGKLTMTPEAAQRWLIVLNDMRLALGTHLEVSADSFDDFDPGDPDNGPLLAYAWLGEAQNELLNQVMR